MEKLLRPMAYINFLSEEGTKEEMLGCLIQAENKLFLLMQKLDISDEVVNKLLATKPR